MADRFSRSFFAILVILYASANSLFGAPQGDELLEVKVGDKVEVHWFSKWISAEVVSVNDVGFIVGKFKDENGKDRESIFRKGDFRSPAKGGVDPKPEQSEKSENNGVDAGPPREMRTWTDTTGKFQIEAAFDELVDGKVHLKKSDGKILKIQLDKLSPKDQRLARRLSKTSGTSEKPATAPIVGRLELGAPNTIDPNWKSARGVTLENVRAAVPTDVLAAPRLEGQFKLIKLQAPAKARDHFFEKISGVIFHAATGDAIVVYINAPPMQKSTVRLERCDLVAGRSKGAVEFVAEGNPVDVSPNGNQVICLNESNIRESYLEILTFDGNNSIGLTRFRPTTNRSLKQCGFVDDSHLWTFDDDRVFTVWRTKDATAIYATSFGYKITFGLSINKRLLAVHSPEGHYILNVLDGTTLSKLDGTPAYNVTSRFSDDGRRLAAISTDQLRVWNLETGELEHHMYQHLSHVRESVALVDTNIAMIGTSHLIDLPSQVLFWEYKRDSDHHFGLDAMIFNNWAWYADSPDGSNHVLIGCRIPTPDAMKAAANIDVKRVMDSQRGEKIDLRVQGRDADQTQRIGNRLYKQLQDRGMDIVAKHQSWIEATVTPVEQKATDQKVKAEPKEMTCRMSFHTFGKTPWEVTAVLPNTTEAIENFFIKTPIPRYLKFEMHPLVQGATAVNHRGISSAESVQQQFGQLEEEAKRVKERVFGKGKK